MQDAHVQFGLAPFNTPSVRDARSLALLQFTQGSPDLLALSMHDQAEHLAHNVCQGHGRLQECGQLQTKQHVLWIIFA